MKKIHCALKECNKEFMPVNGNTVYCSNQCYMLAKKVRQKIVEGLVKDFRKGVYKNLKTFTALHTGTGVKEFPLETLLLRGFDEYAYYQTLVDNKKQEWYKVGDYYFRSETKDAITTVHIYKPK